MSRKQTVYSERGSYLGIPGVSQRVRGGKLRTPPPPVPVHAFVNERDLALNAKTPSGPIALDLGAELAIPWRATTPSLFATYLCMQPGDAVASDFVASAEMYLVIQGEGSSTWGDETLDWQAGDVFFLPGGSRAMHRAKAQRAVLYAVCDEPLARFLGLESPPGGSKTIPAAHYHGDHVMQMQRDTFEAANASGVIHFGIDGDLAYSSFIPTWKWMRPGEQQEPHCHAAVALQIIVRAAQCHSVVNDQRIDWQDYLVVITPAGHLHSHHSNGSEPGMYLITQDVPLYKHLRGHWYKEPGTGIVQQDWSGSGGMAPSA
jgi:mannose-6-phosphate isomerase-like protein (cupin superfamily)